MKNKFTTLFLVGVFGLLVLVGAFYYKSSQDVSPIKDTALVISTSSNLKTVNPSQEDVSVTNLKKTSAEIASEIREKNFELLQSPRQITFAEALDKANYVSNLTKIRPAFLLAIFQEELALEKFDMCYLTNLKTGDGVRVTDNMFKPKTMHPTRDLPPFIKIMKELGKDPLNTLITCPMSFGWGGAMGPADFIPSTWMMYKKRVESVTKKPADPWNIEDAFLAAGLFLADAGAKSKNSSGERKAATIYFSGSANSPHTFYADGALKIAEQIQKDIDVVEALLPDMK